MAKEARNWSQLADMDVFFFYDEVELDYATEHDIAMGVIQPKRSLFYDREDSAGVSEYENTPQSIYTEIVIKYDIASWIARRNQLVGDGQGGTQDRRVATSQSAIETKQANGELDVQVLFVAFADLQQPTQLTIPLGGGLQ